MENAPKSIYVDSIIYHPGFDENDLRIIFNEERKQGRIGSVLLHKLKEEKAVISTHPPEGQWGVFVDIRYGYNKIPFLKRLKNWFSSK